MNDQSCLFPAFHLSTKNSRAPFPEALAQRKHQQANERALPLYRVGKPPLDQVVATMADHLYINY